MTNETQAITVRMTTAPARTKLCFGAPLWDVLYFTDLRRSSFHTLPSPSPSIASLRPTRLLDSLDNTTRVLDNLLCCCSLLLGEILRRLLGTLILELLLVEQYPRDLR